MKGIKCLYPLGVRESRKGAQQQLCWNSRVLNNWFARSLYESVLHCSAFIPAFWAWTRSANYAAGAPSIPPGIHHWMRFGGEETLTKKRERVDQKAEKFCWPQSHLHCSMSHGCVNCHEFLTYWECTFKQIPKRSQVRHTLVCHHYTFMIMHVPKDSSPTVQKWKLRFKRNWKRSPCWQSRKTTLLLIAFKLLS